MGQCVIFCNLKSILSKQKCQEEEEDHRQAEDPAAEAADSSEEEAQPELLQLPQDHHHKDRLHQDRLHKCQRQLRAAAA